jgi:hypothetical protein
MFPFDCRIDYGTHARRRPALKRFADLNRRRCPAYTMRNQRTFSGTGRLYVLVEALCGAIRDEETSEDPLLRANDDVTNQSLTSACINECI